MEPEKLSAVDLTRILREWGAGTESALERAGHLLQPSALVNEAYVRLLAGKPVEWKSRTHFFAYSARLMRQILVDFARAQMAERRGGGPPNLADLSAIKEVPSICCAGAQRAMRVNTLAAQNICRRVRDIEVVKNS